MNAIESPQAELRVEAFQSRLAKNGLRSTRQREIIARAFFSGGHRHVTIDELLLDARAEDQRIGYATVYRTLKLLVECNMAKARRFGDTQTRYEPFEEGSHHDHLICTSCGLIVEFENETIEELQEDVAREHGYSISHHKMELYGHCRGCQQSS
jgi:Fur family ferric uptake transcriptional regulator